jgi:hypothetical protein
VQGHFSLLQITEQDGKMIADFVSARSAPDFYTIGPVSASSRLETFVEEINCLAALRRMSKKVARGIPLR